MKWFSLVFSLVFFCTLAQADAKILNVYNWSDFLPAHLIKQFEKETGITVNYAEFDNNETLYTKIKHSKIMTATQRK